ncbi:MAG: hypothetical protein HC855_02020 [Rhizobiales bacterium]|nr:hypothetical protein [Hyphomicrobiales bacterium]
MAKHRKPPDPVTPRAATRYPLLDQIRAPADLRKLVDWLAEYRADLWDKQIEEDAKAGKLDKLFAEAEAEIAAGKVRPL